MGTHIARLIARRVARTTVVVMSMAAATLLCGCAGALLLYPTTGPRSAGGAERVVVPFETGDLELWSLTTRAAETAPPEAVVLAFCGNASRAENMAPRLASLLADRPARVVAVNYPGYGGSAGSASLGGIAESALVAFDALSSLEPQVPVICWGESIGSTAALHVAAERDVAGVVVRNPPPLRRLILRRHGWWNLWLAAVPVAFQIPSELDAPHTAPRVTAPAVFLLSPDDEVVPISYQRAVHEAYGGTKEEILLAGGHNGGLDAAETARVRAAYARLLDGLPDR